jgi:hypothetical protein
MTRPMLVRAEIAPDASAIAGVIARAFASHPFSSQTAHFIVGALRKAGALAVSLL